MRGSVNNQDYGVILFDSTQQALKTEKALKRAGFVIKLIPVPRQLSSDCGICLRFTWADCARIKEALAAAHLEVAGIYHLS